HSLYALCCASSFSLIALVSITATSAAQGRVNSAGSLSHLQLDEMAAVPVPAGLEITGALEWNGGIVAWREFPASIHYWTGRTWRSLCVDRAKQIVAAAVVDSGMEFVDSKPSRLLRVERDG